MSKNSTIGENNRVLTKIVLEQFYDPQGTDKCQQWIIYFTLYCIVCECVFALIQLWRLAVYILAAFVKPFSEPFSIKWNFLHYSIDKTELKSFHLINACSFNLA